MDVNAKQTVVTCQPVTTALDDISFCFSWRVVASYSVVLEVEIGWLNEQT